MKIRKGPCGSFAVELVQESQIYTYALEIIESAMLDGVLPAFDEEKKMGIDFPMPIFLYVDFAVS